VKLELGGYNVSEEAPRYREFHAQVEAFDRYRGWISVVFEDPKMTEIISKPRRLGGAVPDLEAALDQGADDYPIIMPLPDEMRYKTMREHGVSDVGVRISRFWIMSVLAAVRDLILDWSLKLEKLGITGEGMSFSQEEKKKNAAAKRRQLILEASVNSPGPSGVNRSTAPSHIQCKWAPLWTSSW
jgi:AbiTii